MTKNRNPLLVVLLMILTCGLYGLYWYYSTAAELKAKGHLDMSPLLLVVLLFIPLLGFYSMWVHCQAIEGLSGGKKSGLLCFVLLLVFFPAFVFVFQSELNQHSS